MPRKRTGTVQPYTDATGLSYWRARIRLSDGSRPWLRVPEAHGYTEARAREWAASMQEREDREGKLAAAKVQLQAIAPPPAETVAKWSERWLKAREQRGLATFRHDEGCRATLTPPHGRQLHRPIPEARRSTVVRLRESGPCGGEDDGRAGEEADGRDDQAWRDRSRCDARRHGSKDGAQRKHITFHDLRATGITWMAVAGEDPLRIKQRAGHQSFSTTEGYIREAENLRTGFGEPFPPLPASLLQSNERSNVPRRGPKSASIPASYFVEQRGIEPLTSALRTQRSPS